MYYDSLIAAARQNPEVNDLFVELSGGYVSFQSEYGLWLKKDGVSIGPPTVEEKLEYPPGFDAVLDMTQAVDGKVHFKQRSVTLEFLCLRPKNQWETIRSRLETALQGQWLAFYLSCWPLIREGLFTVELTPGEHSATVSVSITCAP